jgi:hypothetical protein
VSDAKIVSLAQAREREAELDMYRAKLKTLYVRQSFIEAEITQNLPIRFLRTILLIRLKS